MKNNKKIAFSLLLLPLLALSACNEATSSEEKSEVSSENASTSENISSSEEKSEEEASSSEENSSEESSSEAIEEKHKVTFYLYDDVKVEKEVKHNELVEKPTNPIRKNYIFAGWFTSPDGVEEFYFGTKIVKDTDIYAHWSEDEGVSVDVLKKAFEADYSNSIVMYETTAQIKDPFMVTNVDGYNIAEGFIDNHGDGQYLYYHDYNNLSYCYFNDATHGGAWIREGQKFPSGGRAELGIDNIYFKADVHLSKLNASDFVYKAGSFHLVDQDKVKAAVSRGAFSYVHENPIAQVNVILDETNTYVSKIITYDSLDPNDNSHTVTAIESINQVPTWNLSTLPEKPNENNVKTWYEWKEEKEPNFDNIITEMNVSFKADQSSEIYVDELIKLQYTLNPITPDRKDIELKVEGPQDGLELKYDFGENSLKARAYKEGNYKVYLHDNISKVDSNKLEIKVLDTKKSTFDSSACLYDLKLGYDKNNELELKNSINKDNSVKLSHSAQCFKLSDGFTGSENPKFDEFAQAMRFDFCTNECINVEGDDSYVVFELNKDINAMSFTYATLFKEHADKMNSTTTHHVFKGTISTSSDGSNFEVVKDITGDIEKNVSVFTTRRYDINFINPTKFIKIGFDSLQINNGLSIVMDSWQFFNLTK